MADAASVRRPGRLEGPALGGKGDLAGGCRIGARLGQYGRCLHGFEEAHLAGWGAVGAAPVATAVDRGRKPRVQGLAGEVDPRSAPGAVHGDEVAGALIGDAELSQLRLAEGGLPSCPTDELGAAHADAGHAQKRLQRRAVHLHGEEVQVVQGPVRLRIDIGGEEGIVLVDDLAHVKAVEAQEPVGLVEAVLAVQLHGVGGGQERVGHDGEVGAEEHALQRQVGVEGR